MPTEHAVFLMRYLDVGVNPEEEKRRDFSQQRGQSRTADAHLRQTNMTEDQSPVEENVDHRHDDSRKGDDLGAADADIEGAEQEVEHHEHDAELPEFQIFVGRYIDIFRLNDDMQQSMAEKEQDAEQQDAQTQHKQSTMLKHHADFAKVALSVTPRDENLYTDGKAHRQSGEDEVIQARHHGGTQLDGAEVTQESGVGKSNDGLCQVAQHDGVSNTPDFLVCYSGFNHAAKLGIS